MTIIETVFQSFGLKLNYVPQKTAALLKLRGERSNDLSYKLFNEDKAKIGFQTTDGRGAVDVITTYCHLGGHHTVGGSLNPEQHKRFTK